MSWKSTDVFTLTVQPVAEQVVEPWGASTTKLQVGAFPTPGGKSLGSADFSSMVTKR